MKKTWLSALVSGALFGVGLGVAGMTRPEKIIAFLDITGDWDPSLLFVMGGALVVYFVAHRLLVVRERGVARPLLAPKFELPTRRDLDRSLLAGAFVFGVGWGLAGYCPGPAIVALTGGALNPFVFVASMIAGMIIYRVTILRASGS